MRVLDVADDLGALLESFVRAVGVENLPEVVKTAEWREPARARDRDFALILVDDDGTSHRKYACHDPGSTLVSMLYLQHAQPHLNPAAIKTAAANLGRLALDWGLEVPDEVEKMAAIELPEGDERDVLDERRVTYRPPRLVQKAAEASGPFAKLASARREWHDMTPHERHHVAVELVKEAASLPLVVPPEIYRYSGESLSPRFAQHMRARQELTSNPDCAEAYGTLAKMAGAFPPQGVVDALYSIDEAAHLRWAGGDRYGEKVADPVLCVYDHVKEAAYLWNHGSDFVTEHDLFMFVKREFARGFFTDTFRDELWWPFERDPVGVFAAMTLEHKKLLSRMAREE